MKGIVIKKSQYIPWVAGFLLFVVLFAVNPDYGIISAPIILIVLSLMMFPRKLWALVPAVIIGGSWVFLARDMYSGYNLFQLSFSGVTLFPLFAWVSGLYLFYLLLGPAVGKRTRKVSWFIQAGTYCFVIIIAEYIGYNILGIHLDAGTAYTGWPVLNIFHCPLWMQAGYFANGLIFTLVVSILRPVMEK
jgi:hypothetical protein